MALDVRKKRILEAVVEQFIYTGEPVGSKYVAAAMENSEAVPQKLKKHNSHMN